MKIRFVLCVAVGALFGSTSLAIAADTDAAGGSATIPATSQLTTAAVHPAMAEVFRPAPMPGEDHAPAQRVAEAGASFHPDVLSMSNAGSATDSNSIDYDRNQRTRPAGGMSLNIPMQ